MFWVVMVMLIVGPIGLEALIVSISREDAIFPKATLLAGEVLLFIVLITVLVFIMVLGNDFEFGIVRSVLSRGVDRHYFIISKTSAAGALGLVYGFAYVISSLILTVVAHSHYSEIPLNDVVGGDFVLHALESIGVVGLTSFVFGGVVMLALVLGKRAWVGMVAGLGLFMIDFNYGVVSLAQVEIFRYSVTHHAFSLLTRSFGYITSGMSLSGLMRNQDLADPGWSLGYLILIGCVINLIAIGLFHFQDLMTKN